MEQQVQPAPLALKEYKVYRERMEQTVQLELQVQQVQQA
jgi:hypothetical protein